MFSCFRISPILFLQVCICRKLIEIYFIFMIMDDREVNLITNFLLRHDIIHFAFIAKLMSVDLDKMTVVKVHIIF